MHKLIKIIRKNLIGIIIFIIILVVSLTMAYPYIWMFGTSFKETKGELFSTNMIDYFSIKSFTLENYKNLSSSGNVSLFKMLFNSTVLAIGGTIINLIFCILVADTLSRKKIFGKNAILFFFIVTMIIPVEVVAIPLYLVLIELHLFNTYIGVILSLSAEAVSVLILYRFFKEIPREIVESAMIDGANDFRIIKNIILPLGRSAIYTVIILQFVSCWNAFIIPLIASRGEAMHTLQIGMSFYNNAWNVDFRSIMAMGTIITLPVIIIFIFTQRLVIKGITGGAVKE